MSEAQLQALWSMEDWPGRVTVFRDWDYYISSFRSLRYHLFQHQMIPLWDPGFCAGRPELSNPQAYGWTWVSAFAYALPPFWGLLMVWLILTAAGVAAVRSLLVRAGCTSYTAGLCAVVYGMTGYFTAHFNQGIVTFAFFHLIPLLLVLFDRCAARAAGRGAVLPGIALTAVTFLLFTGGLPHALFYFYPAFVLYVLWRFLGVFLAGRGAAGPVPGIAGLLRATFLHVVGIGLAGYKLVPVAVWQSLQPRKGVLDEQQFPLTMLGNLLRMDSNYDDVFAQVFDGQVWFAWEYNAYIGPGLLILALIGLVTVIRARLSPSPGVPGASAVPAPLRDLGVYGLVCLLAGVLLSTGNLSWWQPGQWFKSLPLLSGIRVFARFQVLIIFGCVILGAAGLEWLVRTGRLQQGLRRLALVLVVSGPVLLQAGLHVWNIRGVSDQELARKYPLPGELRPLLVTMQGNFVREGFTHMDYILRQGGFVANCYDPMNLPRVPLVRLADFEWAPVSEPPPSSVRFRRDGMDLMFPADTAEIVVNAWSPGAGLRFDPEPLPGAVQQQGAGQFQDDRSRIQLRSAPDRLLEVRFTTPGLGAGITTSLVAAVLLAGTLLVIGRS